MKKFEQYCLMGYSSQSFQEKLNDYLKKGWQVVPITLVVTVKDVWFVVVEKEID